MRPASERLFGYRAEEVIGRNVKMLMPIRTRKSRSLCRSVPEDGVRKIIGLGREVIGQRKDGYTFPHVSVSWRGAL
jgi:PAS domain S-box-containing protein